MVLPKEVKEYLSNQNHTENDYEKDIAITNTIISEETFGTTRVNMVLTNVSGLGEKVYLSFGKEAKIGTGIVLNDGDTYITSADAGYIPSQKRVNAIATAAAKLSIHEEWVQQ